MRDLRDLIPDPSSLEIPEIDYSRLGDLSKLKLISLRAEPEEIQPFGTSVISWEVEDDDSRCRIQLNGVAVPTVGSWRVRPDRDWPYYLKGNNGQNIGDLGMVMVRVNTSSCSTDTFSYVNQAVKNMLQQWTREMTGLRLRGNATEAIAVRTGSGNIHFELYLEYVANNLPNPRVDIRGDVAINVIGDGPFQSAPRLNGYFQNLNINAYFDWHQSLAIAAGGPVVAVAAAQARDSAEQAARENIDPLWDRVLRSPTISGVPPLGTSIHSVQLTEGANGLGEIRRTFCPTPTPLRPRGDTPPRRR